MWWCRYLQALITSSMRHHRSASGIDYRCVCACNSRWWLSPLKTLLAWDQVTYSTVSPHLSCRFQKESFFCWGAHFSHILLPKIVPVPEGLPQDLEPGVGQRLSPGWRDNWFLDDGRLYVFYSYVLYSVFYEFYLLNCKPHMTEGQLYKSNQFSQSVNRSILWQYNSQKTRMLYEM